MMRQLVLSDDLTVFSLNADETRFIHREVFLDKCYMKHGIELQDGNCVFDVGSNIGLSALFFHRERRGIRIYAFEPSPAAFECLKANMELHGADAHLYQCGLSNVSGSGEFTFYPGNTIASGFHADVDADRDTSKTFMVNKGLTPEKADWLLGFLFKRETFRCPLRTLSEVVDEEKVTQIDLLKIDAEKSEKQVLAGIRDEHWDRIRQVAMEVHGADGGLEQVDRTLGKYGFHVTAEQDVLLKGTEIFYVFATRQ